jgi:hypothetical protein
MFRPLLLGHHQARKEQKPQLIELCHNFNMDPYYVLTGYFQPTGAVYSIMKLKPHIAIGDY